MITWDNKTVDDAGRRQRSALGIIWYSGAIPEIFDSIYNHYSLPRSYRSQGLKTIIVITVYLVVALTIL